VSAARYLMASEIRRRAGAVALLAAVAAVVTAVSLTAVAGARRSASVPDRFVEMSRPAELLVDRPVGAPLAPQLEAVNGVAGALDATLLGAFPAGSSEDEFYPLLAPTGTVVPEVHNRPIVVDGRLADPDAPHEVAVGERTARRLSLEVGGVLQVVSLRPGQEFGDEPRGPTVDVRVVGITRDLEDITAQETRPAITLLTPAFRDRYLPDIAPIGELTLVALDPGADVRAVTRELRRLGDVNVEHVDVESTLAASLRPSSRAAALGLVVFGIVALVAGVAAFGQLTAREAQRGSVDGRVMASLGVERRDRWMRAAGPGLVAVGAGVPLGLIGSVVASPFHPIGQARLAEIDPGVHVDGAVLAVGGLLAAVVFGGVVTWNALRATRLASAVSAPGRASVVASSAASAGLPPSVVSGLSMALRQGGGATAPVRPATAAVGVGVCGVIAALVFASSLDRLAATPALYGTPWQALVEGADLSDLGAAGPDDPTAADSLAEVAGVDHASDVYFQLGLTLDGRPVAGQSVMDPGVSLGHRIVAGEAPTGEAEVALGRRSLDAAGLAVGDEVEMALAGEPAPFRVVGVAILPSTTDGSPIAEGAVLPAAGLERLGFSGCGEASNCYRNVALQLGPGADLATVRAALPDGAHLALPLAPAEVVRLEQVARLPWAIAGFLAALAGIALVHTTSTLVRRRRHELAVLRCIGFTRRQVRTTVTTQVVALVTTGAAVGAVLGVVAGRQLWRLVADAISVGYAPRLPLGGAAVVLAGVALAAHLATVPSRRSAGRLRPATVLRTE
jgi:hypothetical protein